MKFAFGAGVAGIFLSLGIEGCGGISNPNDIVFPSDSVSYAKQVEPYLALACETSGCHNATDIAGGVDLSSWYSIRNTNGVAVPGDSTSKLILVMYGTVLHRAPISANNNDRMGIKTWVMEGAKNN